jgi:hypothetical protein
MKKLFFLLPAAAIVSMGCEPTYDVYIFNHQDSLLAQSEYLISADECHILKMNGPEFLPQ